jgi:hypothetical protein
MWAYNTSASAGQSYVVFGKAGGAAVDLSSLAAGVGGFVIVGELQNDISGDSPGTSVASAGDVNGDGFDDLIIGARAASDARSMAGKSYVIFGGDYLNYQGGQNILQDAFTGTTGNDSLSGTGSSDVVAGDAGDDVLTGNGGADRIYGGTGNDTIVINADNLMQLGSAGSGATVNGGTGLNTLKFDASALNISLDLSSFVVRANLADINHMDITGGGNNTLKVNLASVFDLADANVFNNLNSSLQAPQKAKQLMVTGNAGDTVNITDFSNWTDTTTSVTSAGHTYHLWTNANVELLIDQTIVVA